MNACGTTERAGGIGRGFITDGRNCPPPLAGTGASRYTGRAMAKTPQTRADYRHFLRIPTRWRDNDVYQHVNNTEYYSYFDTVINAYLIREGGLDYENGDIVGLAIETHCEFHKAIRFPQVVDAGLRVGKLGNSSVRYEVGIFIEGDDACAAEGHFVHVFVKRPENRPTPIPDRLRAAMAKLLVPSH
jgi:acyl-CoA thioester hydrolase